MKCFCEQEDTLDLKIEGDVGAEPIWCSKCGCNFDLEDISFSNELKDELGSWANEYGNWIDWDKDKIVPAGIEMEEEHNKKGIILTDKVKKELGGKYRITFSSSTMARAMQVKNQNL
ncbi:hypothetical protein [Halalkalibacter akibai]|uniref:Uncharacterized protein n=1 Tax=Halalkalibacter akibai (strain ATCC 43226 / DSM 21942 / CIP 109018 / JCM 9157 / 1139) TaxID=1236973 RepID=W4QZ74_HALA3|nr:hypothetical protein [Halalkalibacter akibai]GAE37420.1 hypothetical protein JCM9157_4719 [Halalkalibacter akibai JCM 9157]